MCGGLIGGLIAQVILVTLMFNFIHFTSLQYEDSNKTNSSGFIICFSSRQRQISIRFIQSAEIIYITTVDHRHTIVKSNLYVYDFEANTTRVL